MSLPPATLPPAPAPADRDAVTGGQPQPGRDATIPPSPLPQRRRPPLLWLVGAAAIVLAVLAVVILMRARGDGTPDPAIAGAAGPGTVTGGGAGSGTASPAPAASVPPSAPASARPSGAAPAPLLAPGQKIALDATQEITIPLCGGLRAILTITSIDVQPSGRLTADYSRNVPAKSGVACTLALPADAGSSSITLQVTDRAGGVVFYPAVGGRGLAVSGSENIYGKELSGAWVFDRVDLDGTRVDLVESNANGSDLYRIKLLPR